MRQIKQITSACSETNLDLFALCDDESIWYLDMGVSRRGDAAWEKLLPIPQDKVNIPTQPADVGAIPKSLSEGKHIHEKESLFYTPHGVPSDQL